jgi:hypothetical protein
MPLAIKSPRIVTHKEGTTWTATLYVEGVWHGQLKGYATRGEARAAIRERYLGDAPPRRRGRVYSMTEAYGPELAKRVQTRIKRGVSC